MPPRVRSKKARSKDPIKVSDVLTASFKDLSITSKLKEYRIFMAWGLAVGSAIAARTEPVRLMGGKLYVHVSSQSWLNELLYQKSALMEKLNTAVGEEAVSDIVFRFGKVNAAKWSPPAVKKVKHKPERRLTPKDRNFIETTVSELKDPKLKAKIRAAMIKSKVY